MPRLRTHYDNLKVARDAPIEVIRAAYKSLAAKYHPDKHSGSEKAAQIMRVINHSYEILSDADKKAEHDRWIATQESPAREEPVTAEQPEQTPEPIPFTPLERIGIWQHPWKLIGAVAVCIFILFSVSLSSKLRDEALSQKPTPTPTTIELFDPSEVTPVKELEKPPYIRPEFAPNLIPWPERTGYMMGYNIINTRSGGKSTVSIDNRQNSADVFGKICILDPEGCVPARVFFLRGHEQFTADKLAPGAYDFRYQNLDTGEFFKSERFTLKESINDEENEIQFNHITLTLYKVLHGNAKFDKISEDQF